jgi:hypothetical protein
VTKCLASAAAIAVMLIGGQAAAVPTGDTGYSFTPANEAFQVNGTMSFSIPGQPIVNCNVVMTGQTGDHGALAITAAAFTDNGDGSCSNVEAPNVHAWFWNPTALYIGHWLHARVFLSPKGIECRGNLTLKVTEPIGGDTTTDIQEAMASPAGVCTATAHFDIGNVVITSTPGE